MGVVGVLALAANAGVALMLYRWRGGDANMRSVWICSRNDAVGNAAVVLAAAGVAAGSASLQADALDFLGDAANYAISLGVAGMALAWRARAALAKGLSLAVLAVWVIATTV